MADAARQSELSAGEDSSPRWLVRVSGVAFGGVLLLAVASVWSVEYFPTQDGPAHIALVSVWMDYQTDQGDLYRQYFEENPNLAPNWTTTLAVRGLLTFTGPQTAHKILVSVLIVGFAASAWYAMSAIDKHGSLLAVLVLPFATSWYLHMGFFNFVASVIGFLVVVGYWLRHGRNPTPGRVMTLGLLLLAVYFSHMVSLVEAWMLLGVLTLVWTVNPRPQDTDRSFLLRLWTSGRGPLLASLPAAALLAGYLASSEGELLLTRRGLPWLRRALTLWDSIPAFNSLEHQVSRVLALLLFVGFVAAIFNKVRRRHWVWSDALLVVALLMLIAAAVAPVRAAGGSIISPRLMLYPVLIGVIWLASQQLGPRIRVGLVVGGAALSMTLIGIHLDAYRTHDAQVREVVTASTVIEPGSTVLPVSWFGLNEPPFFRVNPLLYSPSWIAIETQGVDLGNLDAFSAYSPLVFRPERSPATHILAEPFGLEEPPPQGEILGYTEKTGGTIDYLLVIGLEHQGEYETEKSQFLVEISRAYELIFESSTGLARVYERVGHR